MPAKEEKSKLKKILIIHGPNLNLLGLRDKVHYGTLTLDKLNKKLRQKARELGVELKIFQSNHEGEIVTIIQRQRNNCVGILINPAAYTHYSIAIRDALELVPIPAVEVHLSDISQREEFRRISVTKDVCIHQIYGKKEESYLEGLHFLVDYLKEKEGNT